jgi:hypothetical protein
LKQVENVEIVEQDENTTRIRKSRRVSFSAHLHIKTIDESIDHKSNMNDTIATENAIANSKSKTLFDISNQTILPFPSEKSNDSSINMSLDNSNYPFNSSSTETSTPHNMTIGDATCYVFGNKTMNESIIDSNNETFIKENDKSITLNETVVITTPISQQNHQPLYSQMNLTVTKSTQSNENTVKESSFIEENKSKNGIELSIADQEASMLFNEPMMMVMPSMLIDNSKIEESINTTKKTTIYDQNQQTCKLIC